MLSAVEGVERKARRPVFKQWSLELKRLQLALYAEERPRSLYSYSEDSRTARDLQGLTASKKAPARGLRGERPVWNNRSCANWQ